MSNSPNGVTLAFDEELSVDASTFDGTAQVVGTLENNPVMMMIKNMTNVIVFFADNAGSTHGTTMAIGEEIILDCVANHGIAMTRSWPIGTTFYATGSAGVGFVKVSIIYAK